MTQPFTHAFLDGPSVAVNHVPSAPQAELGGRTVESHGRYFDVYPSTLEATRSIWLRGVWVPGPIQNPKEFSWPAVDRSFTPMDHQVKTADFATVYPRSFVLNRPGCVDAATEYLSPEGWKRIDQYDGGEVMQYNRDTQVASFVQPTSYVRKPAAGFYHFKNERGLDQMLSAGHRVLVNWHCPGKATRSQVATAQEVAKTTNAAKGCGMDYLPFAHLPRSFDYEGDLNELPADADMNVRAHRIIVGYGAEHKGYPVSAPEKISTPKGTEQFCFEVPDTFLVLRRNGNIFITGNTGKTASSIWAAEYLLKIGAITKVLVICPKSCMEDVWLEELRTLNPLRRVAICHGANKRNALTGDFDYVITNHDQTKQEPFKTEAPKWQESERLLVIVDEATAYKNYRSARTKGLQRLTNRIDRTWLWMMTGTPHPKDPTDVYGMCKVLNPASVPQTYAMWRDRVMYKAGEFRYKPRADAGTHIRRAMWPAICFKSEDVLELPPRHDTGRGVNISGTDEKVAPVPLTDQQEEMIAALKKDAVAEIKGLLHEKRRPQIIAVHAGALRTKLFQIAQGVVLDDAGVPRSIDCQPRIDDMLEALSQRKKKFLVFCSYKAVQSRVHAVLAQHGLNCGFMNGDTPQGRRKAALAGYRGDRGVHGLVAHPATMAHGLTLTDGDTAFWWGPPGNPEYWDQGNHRVYRKGQEDPVYIWAQAACKEEADYFEVLIERGDLEQATLDMFKPT